MSPFDAARIAYEQGRKDALDEATKAGPMIDTPPNGSEWVEAIVKALNLGYLDALDDVQDRLKGMANVWCNEHGAHVSRNDVHLMIDELRKP